MDAYDVAVVGGGIVGCAILYKLTSLGYKCLLLEKSHLVSGASCGNSGIWHTGFDTETETLEGQCILRARPLASAFYTLTGVPHNVCAAIMVAWDNEQVGRLGEYLRRARAAGQEARLLRRDEVLQLEPAMCTDVLAGLYIPGEAVMDPWLTAVLLAHAARRLGADVECQSEVTSVIRRGDGRWQVRTTQGVYNAHIIINAAGLHGDTVDSMVHPASFRIHPRKGDFAVFGKEASKHVKHIIYSLGSASERTKGIVIFPTVYGNVVVGPTAEDVADREVSMVSADPVTVGKLESYAHSVFPVLRSLPLTGAYTGLRPATQFSDYQIHPHPSQNWITVGGIRSTGATACQGIAAYVSELLQNKLGLLPSRAAPAANAFGATWQPTTHTTMVLDGTEYQITHPITKFGVCTKSNL